MRAAGRCSWPGCGVELDVDFPTSGRVNLGQRAHIIARSPRGPRGGAQQGEDSYENLILLCPSHHSEADKAAHDYPPELLHRYKAAHERRVRQLGSTLRAPPAIWSVPIARRVNFPGRDRFLEELDFRHATAERIQVLQGIAGIGKTQLAAHYAYRRGWRKRDVPVVWWLDIGSAIAADQLADLAAELQLPASNIGQHAVEQVARWMQTNEGWLLIVDGARGPGDLLDLLPDTENGQILVTTLERDWSDLGTVTRVPPLGQRAGVAILRGPGRIGTAGDAAALAKELQGHALGLQQARAYSVATGTSLAHYRSLLRDESSKVLAARHLPFDYPRSVDAALGIGIAAVRKAGRQPSVLLNIAANLESTDIPLGQLVRGAAEGPYPRPLRALARNRTAYDDAVAVLLKYALLEEESGRLSMHPLVQLNVRARQRTNKAIELTYRLLAAALPVNTLAPEGLAAWDELLPHVLAVERRPRSADVPTDLRLRLVELCAARLREKGDYKEAAALLRGGPGGPRPVQELSEAELALRVELGVTLVELDAAEAVKEFTTVTESLHRRGCEGTLLNAKALSGLGWAYYEMGEFRGAVTVLKDAIRLYERLPSSGAPNSATAHAEALMRLGATRFYLHQLGSARSALRRALRLLKRADQDTRLEEAEAENTLGAVEREANNETLAVEHYERALALRSGVLPANHPNVAVTRSNLGCALADIGRRTNDLALVDQAEELHEESLRDLMAIFGRRHERVAAELNMLGLDARARGIILRRLGDSKGSQLAFSEAERSFREALQLRRELFGMGSHPFIAQSLNNVAAILRESGRTEEAIELHERVLAMYRDLKLGPLALAHVREHAALAGEVGGDRSTACAYARAGLEDLRGRRGNVIAGGEQMVERLKALLERLGCSEDGSERRDDQTKGVSKQ